MIEDLFLRHSIASLFALLVIVKVLLWLVIWPLLRAVVDLVRLDAQRGQRRRRP